MTSAGAAPPSVPGLAVGEPLGRGAQATVWAATDARGREVALKLLERLDDTSVARFDRERGVLASLDHPGVVRLLDHGRADDGRPYLVMERVDGQSLRDRVAEHGPLAPSEAWATVRRVADAVAAAHARGVLHRDLTGGNVLLDARGRPRLTDFGLARRAADPKLSRDGASTGTPAYMAPEQWWGAGLDERTDVYGLGAILYEALTGVPPWHGEDPAELLHRVATAAPAPPSARGVELPADVERFVRRCLAREPSRRPTDVAAFVREGDAAFGHRSVWRRLEPFGWAALPLVAAVALGYGDTHDPLTWIHESGYAGWTVLASLPLGAWLAHRFVSARPFVPLLPLLNGALGFATGIAVTGAAVETLPPEDRFSVFHLGFAEASAGWFLGAACAASLMAMVATLEVPLARPDRRAWLGAGIALAAGTIAWNDGALAVGVVAALLCLRGGPSRGPALAAVGATASLGLMAWVRLASDAARLWQSPLDRAARAERLTALDGEQVAVLGATLVVGLAVAATARWAGVRTWPRRRLILGAVGAALTVATLAAPWAWTEARRAELAAALAPHFSVWSALDPPSGEVDHPARLGVTLQIGRQQIAVDGAPVLPTRALDGSAGTASLVLAQALGPALATAAGDAPQLVLAADRSLDAALVTRALAVASDLGVERVDVVLVPGDPLRLSPNAPAEAAMVLPRDLRAFEVRLAEDGLQPDRAERFDDLVARLRREPVLRPAP